MRLPPLSTTHSLRASLLLLCFLAAHLAVARTQDLEPRFDSPRQSVELYDLYELAVTLPPDASRNPFRDVEMVGTFQPEGQAPIQVEGFCDAPDGSRYLIRFMPRQAVLHSYRFELRRGSALIAASEGRFEVVTAGRTGPIRVDPAHPFHFQVEGTDQHWYWNGSTTYWLLGWTDESIIEHSLDRLAGLKVNRIRVALNGRTTGGERWYEPLVVNSDSFRFQLDPWPARQPGNVQNPDFDLTRFNIPFWQKCDRMMRHARERGIVVSLIFHLDGRDPGVDPFGKDNAGNEDERGYYRYAVARLAAYSNVMWDVTNEWHLFRDEAWVNRMGRLLKEADPYDHLLSVHGKGEFPFRSEPWADFALFQSWDEMGGHAFMLKNRREQAATGRPTPQVNEEYGYEDHYPGPWGGGRRAPARSADNRRRLAWEIAMAGCYQTTGERANRGTGKGPDSGGGWLTGRGDDSMTLLRGHAFMVDCFQQLQYWKLEPSDQLATDGAYCLAEPGKQYLVYLPRGGRTTLSLEGTTPYLALRYNPRTGDWTDIGMATGPAWTSPQSPDAEDWALVLLVSPP